MEPKVDNLTLSKKEKLDIYISVLRKLISIWRYNLRMLDDINLDNYQNFKSGYICMLLSREIEKRYKKYPSSSDLFILFPEVTLELAVEKFNGFDPGDDYKYSQGWWAKILISTYLGNMEWPNLESRIAFMEYVIKITKDGTN